LEDYVQAALAAGLSAYGPSSHAPVPWANTYSMQLADVPAYVAETRRLQEEYTGQIEVYLGLELDFRPDLYSFYQRHIFPHGFDYFIGSLHLLKALDDQPWSFEDTHASFERGLRELYDGDIRRLLEDYFGLLRQVVEWPEVAVVGHLDRVKVYNHGEPYYAEQAPWYVDLVESTLEAIARSGKILELNTAGWRKANPSPNPDPWVVRRCAERGIAMCITPDAHRVEQIAFRYAEAVDLMQWAGHRHVSVLQRGQWTPIPLDH
jgi:histidinol-phosphatase (PHP family)